MRPQRGDTDKAAALGTGGDVREPVGLARLLLLAVCENQQAGRLAQAAAEVAGTVAGGAFPQARDADEHAAGLGDVLDCDHRSILRNIGNGLRARTRLLARSTRGVAL